MEFLFFVLVCIGTLSSQKVRGLGFKIFDSICSAHVYVRVEMCHVNTLTLGLPLKKLRAKFSQALHNER